MGTGLLGVTLGAYLQPSLFAEGSGLPFREGARSGARQGCGRNEGACSPLQERLTHGGSVSL